MPKRSFVKDSIMLNKAGHESETDIFLVKATYQREKAKFSTKMGKRATGGRRRCCGNSLLLGVLGTALLLLSSFSNATPTTTTTATTFGNQKKNNARRFGVRSYVADTLALKRSISTKEITTLDDEDISSLLLLDPNNNNNRLRGGSENPPNVVQKLLPPGFTVENLSGAVFFIVLDMVLSRLFTKYGIAFPAQLGGCLILFALMVLIPPLGQQLYKALNPGAELLAQWIGVCFIGGVVMLPTAPSVGGPVEILKIITVILGGAYVTCFSTTFTVLGIRKLSGSLPTKATPPVKVKAAPPKAAPAAVKKQSPFSAVFLRELLLGSLLSGGFMIGLTRFSPENNDSVINMLNTAYLTLSTVAAFVWSVRLPSSFNKIVHPIFTSTGIIWILMQVTSLLTGTTFRDVLGTYKTSSGTGAGAILLNLLGPCVISFAMAIYNRRQLLLENLLVVASGVFVSAFGTLYGTAAFVRAVSLGGTENGALLRLSTLARNVVAPLAVVICKELGGNTSIQLAIVVVTGILGATFARSWLDAANIKDPVSRGMGVGGCGLSLAAASMAQEPEAFPFAILAFVFNAMLATIIAITPALKEPLIELATGTAT